MSLPPIVKKSYSYDTVIEVRSKYKKPLREWLRAQRADKTLQQLGEALGCSKQFVSIIEVGTHLPSNNVALKWSEALDISPLEFQLKAGTAPPALLYDLGWRHYDKFIAFLDTLKD